MSSVLQEAVGEVLYTWFYLEGFYEKKVSKADGVTERYLTTMTNVVEDNIKMHFKE